MKKKIALNSVSSLALQIVTVIIGLILPRLIIGAFGSSINGLVNSITQFLSYITLFEAGVGGAVRAVLYKPLVNNDTDSVSGIIKAANIYFKKLGVFFLIYVSALSVVYPIIINKTYNGLFTGSLIWIIAISTFAQYFIGITYAILLQADMRSYFTNTIQIISMILNAVLIVVLINYNANIHMVKLISSIVYTVKPIVLAIIVKRKYHLNGKCEPNNKALEQKNYALAHHVAWFLQTNTDVVIITVFSSLVNVSIYSVYNMVAMALTNLSSALVTGVEAAFGKMMAGHDEQIRDKFEVYNMIMAAIVIVLFSTASCMLIPFVKLYTQNIADANYIVPMLGYFLIAAQGVYCLRIPYHSIITAAGHFKQTQTSAIIEASSNVLLSIILIKICGVPGVAIATFLSMLYRTVYYIFYLSKNIMMISFKRQIIRLISCAAVVLMLSISKMLLFDVECFSFIEWTVQSVIIAIIGTAFAVLYSFIFYRRALRRAINLLKR